MPPLMWRVAMYVAAWWVPPLDRAEWRRQWLSNLASWRVLVERGELPVRGGFELLWRAYADAFHQRFGVVVLHRFMRGPVFLMAVCVAALALIAILSGGFATSRWVIALVRDVRLHPFPGLPYDFRGDRIIAYTAPIVIAAAVGFMLLFLRRRDLFALGWKSLVCLGLKVSILYVTEAMLWVEGGHALRSHITSPGLHFGVAGLGLAVVFVLSVGFTTLWAIADQRRRCPVCLHRLVMPVTLGSWGSVFDPAVTELVCEQGHGSLALMEADADPSPLDRWTELDSSWQYLFPKQ